MRLNGGGFVWRRLNPIDTQDKRDDYQQCMDLRQQAVDPALSIRLTDDVEIAGMCTGSTA